MNKENLRPYTFNEASSYGDGFPDRGLKCYKCNVLIPQLKELTTEKLQKWKNILKNKGVDEADAYLIKTTGCNPRWAKIWRLHPNGPNAKTEKEASRDINTQCPFCGEPLRTERSKQCPTCFKSWHNENA